MSGTARTTTGPTAADDRKDDSNEDYCQKNLPTYVTEKLQAGAFRCLCEHLRERSDSVQNIDLMTLSGFCRNCLAKWMVLEARRLVDNDGNTAGSSSASSVDPNTAAALDAFGYEEAARHVYGMLYSDWKIRYQKKATDEQMAQLDGSRSLHAVHDKVLLAARGAKPAANATERHGTQYTRQATAGAAPSNVCCQDMEQATRTVTTAAAEVNDRRRTESPSSQPTLRQKTVAGRPYRSPPTPSLDPPAVVAVLTVSDRAFGGSYETGDLSGPAVREAVEEVSPGTDCRTYAAIVPDDESAIQAQILEWCGGGDGDDSNRAGVDIILTTGGTGLSARDITPEACRDLLDQELPGLMAFVASECSDMQPLASLSRGTAGLIRRCRDPGRTAVVLANLPGNPSGASEILPILLPLLLHAVRDLRAETKN